MELLLKQPPDYWWNEMMKALSRAPVGKFFMVVVRAAEMIFRDRY